MPDYIPQKDSELVPWSANFTGQVVANAAAWAIPSGEKFHHRGGKERRPRHPCEYHPHAGGIPFEEPRHHRRATQNRNGTMLGCEYSSGIQINAGLHLGLKDPLDARKNDATVCGLNRILSGEAWKTGNYHRGAVGNDMPVKFYIEAGHRALAEESEIKNRIDNTFFFDLQLLYGNLFSEENEKPYDAFLVDASLNFFSKQPVVGSVNVVGQLWGKNIPLK
ncbi:MAG: hypothetical protein LBC19_01785 [Tannerella sp.]|jgi:hypothetical protein|nr:hypothetical protein [Tannerella sp.]